MCLPCGSGSGDTARVSVPELPPGPRLPAGLEGRSRAGQGPEGGRWTAAGEQPRSSRILTGGTLLAALPCSCASKASSLGMPTALFIHTQFRGGGTCSWASGGLGAQGPLPEPRGGEFRAGFTFSRIRSKSQYNPTPTRVVSMETQS